MKRSLLLVVVVIALMVAVPPVAEANEEGDLTGGQAGGVIIASVSASFESDDDGNAGDTGSGPVPPVDPKVGAARDSQTVSIADELCFVWNNGAGFGAGTAQGQAALENWAAGQLVLAGDQLSPIQQGLAIEQQRQDDILAASLAAQNREPQSAVTGAKESLKSPVRGSLVQVDFNSPEQRSLTTALLARADEANALTTGLGVAPQGQARECLIEYVCAGERVDDVVSGRIDSEPSGAYANYVVSVAAGLDANSAGIRLVEQSAPSIDGPVTVEIPLASSEQGIVSLTGVLAERGLGDAPGDLWLPVFNYCLRGAGGDVEVDPDADPLVQAQFTWTPVENEFDIPGAGANVFDEVTRVLNAHLPDMRTIPPLESGVTIVKFPTWLWLNEPFEFTQAEALSDLGYVRVRGRATFDHVTWVLGDTTLTCELQDMTAYQADAGMNPADAPACHHVFLELGDYALTAQVTYRIEQQVSTSRTGVFANTPWVPHPIAEFVTIESTAGPLSVEPIYSLNVPLTAEQLDEADND